MLLIFIRTLEPSAVCMRLQKEDFPWGCKVSVFSVDTKQLRNMNEQWLCVPSMQLKGPSSKDIHLLHSVMVLGWWKEEQKAKKEEERKKADEERRKKQEEYQRTVFFSSAGGAVNMISSIHGWHLIYLVISYRFYRLLRYVYQQFGCVFLNLSFNPSSCRSDCHPDLWLNCSLCGHDPRRTWFNQDPGPWSCSADISVVQAFAI